VLYRGYANFREHFFSSAKGKNRYHGELQVKITRIVGKKDTVLEAFTKHVRRGDAIQTYR
jgi:hypothetical protein